MTENALQRQYAQAVGIAEFILEEGGHTIKEICTEFKIKKGLIYTRLDWLAGCSIGYGFEANGELASNAKKNIGKKKSSK